MARKKRRETESRVFPELNARDGEEQSSLLDVLDNVLNRGAVLNGDIVLGVANVDLVYVKLSVLLAAMDKVTRRDPIFRPVVAPRRTKRLRPRRKD